MLQVTKEMILREVAGEHILIPVGQAAVEFNGVISLNETACLLWTKLQAGCTEDDLLAALLAEYEVDETTAKADVRAFLDKLRKEGILNEGE